MKNDDQVENLGAEAETQKGFVTLEPKQLSNDGEYDSDLFTWPMEQADFLRNQELARVDWQHISEEFEGLANAQRREAFSHLERTLPESLARLVSERVSNT